MKILKITERYRRDFWADMQCEHCSHVEKGVSGYDDSYFHSEVIPAMKCKKCGKSTKSEGGNVEQTETKYHDSQTV